MKTKFIENTPEEDAEITAAALTDPDNPPLDDMTLAAMKPATKRWNVLDYLKTDEHAVAYLDAALNEGTPEIITSAIGDIARAKGMARVARETGLGRENLSNTLSPDGSPEFVTVLKVLKALGIRLRAQAAA